MIMVEVTEICHPVIITEAVTLVVSITEAVTPEVSITEAVILVTLETLVVLLEEKTSMEEEWLLLEVTMAGTLILVEDTETVEAEVSHGKLLLCQKWLEISEITVEMVGQATEETVAETKAVSLVENNIQEMETILLAILAVDMVEIMVLLPNNGLNRFLPI